MRAFSIVAAVLLVDQLTKYLVVQTMHLGQSIPVLDDWMRFTYTENPGMAFGITFGPPGLVTVFSLIATGLIIYYLVQVRRGYVPYVASLAFILGGALGNIIDRTFYGLIMQGGGLFQGRVVDFIHFNIWRGYLPEGLPLMGGSYVALFPIWNVADMAIVLGVVGIVAFQRRFHEHLKARGAASASPEEPAMEPLEAAPADVAPTSADEAPPRG